MNRAKLSSFFLITLVQITLLFSQSIAQDYDSKAYIYEKRKALSKQFEKEIIKITEGVFVAVGYGASNSVLIEGADSLIIVDAMLGTEAAENVDTEMKLNYYGILSLQERFGEM